MLQTSAKSAVVVGGGIAGLSAAYELQKSGFEVTVLEEKHLPGGRMAEEKVGSFMNITGASGLNSWYREMFDLCDELGHGDSIEKLANFGTGTATDGTVQYPMSNAPSRYELLTSPVLSLRSKLRLASLLPDIGRARRRVDPCLIHTAADFDDESLSDYLTRKVGTDFLEYVVSPLFNVALAYNMEQLLRATVNFPFMATQNCTHSGLAVAASRSTLLAKSTAVERRIDAWMGDQDVIEALFGPGRLEGGVVEALRDQSSDDPQLDRVRSV